MVRAIGPAALLWLSTAVVLSAQTTIVRPMEIDDVLVNPGMGIETFQRFNGQAINDGVHWSEVGPEKAAGETARVDFPASSVAYLRWFWSQIEPQRGTYRWSILDEALAEAHRHGQRLAIRIMPYDDKHPMPDWYRSLERSVPTRRPTKTARSGRPMPTIPCMRKYWSALIVEAGKRYDGHPDLNHVDVSTVGYWGEGWGPYLPSWSIQQQLIDVYFTAFARTPLLMNFDALPALQYGVKRGAGWRLDCWGDMGAPGRSFAHMKDFYPQQLARGGLQDAWRTHPVALETCWVPEQWYQWKFPLKPILDQALRWHASTINIKSSRIPAEWQDGLRRVSEADRIPLRAQTARISGAHDPRDDGARHDVVVQRRRGAGLSALHARTRDRRHARAARCRRHAVAAWGCRGRTSDRRAARSDAGPLPATCRACSIRSRGGRPSASPLPDGRTTGGIRLAKS